ncbi:MAG: hypothetical protein R6V38_02430 [Roseovarius gahaiensis]
MPTADPWFEKETFQKEFRQSIGVPESIPMATAIGQLLGGLYSVTPENEEKINFLLALVASHNPRSLIEAQLLVQMQGAHMLSTKMLKKAESAAYPEVAEKYTNISTKLSRGFRQGLETLSKYRRGGKQYLYIERVNVEKDGQAMIGNMEGGK